MNNPKNKQRRSKVGVKLVNRVRLRPVIRPTMAINVLCSVRGVSYCVGKALVKLAQFFVCWVGFVIYVTDNIIETFYQMRMNCNDRESH